MLPLSEFLYSFSETTRGGRKLKGKHVLAFTQRPFFFLVFLSQEEESVKPVINISIQEDYHLLGCDTV
jgi:hypothetical protein